MSNDKVFLMSYLSLEEAYRSNQRNRPQAPTLIKVDQFKDKSDRTLALGKTGVITAGKIEMMHVYFLDGAIHVFTYCVFKDGERFYGSDKFQIEQAPPAQLRPEEGVAYFTADREFAKLMEDSGCPLRLVPMKVWDQEITFWQNTKYYGKVPTVNCKPHEDNLNIT